MLKGLKILYLRTMKKIIENNKCLYFLKELLKYKKEIGILSISTIVSTVTVFLQPLLIKQITDIGILEKNMPQIVNGVAGLFVCVLVYLMIEVVQAKTFAEIHNSFYKNLYCNVFRKLLHLKKHYFQMKNSSDQNDSEDSLDHQDEEVNDTL